MIDKLLKGKVLKYHLAKAMELIRDGQGEAWLEADEDIILGMATVTGAFLGFKYDFDPDIQKDMNDKRQEIIKSLSICPCCFRTFHEISIHDKNVSVCFPPGIFDKVTRYLNDRRPQKALAITTLMIALDLKISDAKEMVKNWPKIRK